MNFDRDKSKIINYAPEVLSTFKVSIYHWIDNLNFTLDPKEFLQNAEEYIHIASEMFLEAGWDGYGDIELMWLPPFLFREDGTEEFTLGVTIWHVKQLEDGTSWLLSPIKLPFFD